MTEEAAAAAAAPGDTALTNNAPESGDNASSDPSSPPGDGAPDNSASPDDPKGQGESEGTVLTDGAKDGEGSPPADGAVAAPESYEDFSIAEGATVNEEAMGRFKEFAKEQNMPQDAAQQTMDYIAKEMPQFLQEVQQQQLDAYMNMTKEWKESYEKDPGIGGAKMQETETAAKRAINYINDPELVSILDSHNPETNPNGMGLGNHRAIINMLAQFGRTLAEDQHEGGDQHQGGGNALTPEERWYG